MGFIDNVLKLVEKLVDAVNDTINQQTNKVKTEVQDRLLAMIAAGFDEVWRGEDADQFKEKIRRLVSTESEDLLKDLRNSMETIKQATAIIQQADRTTQQIMMQQMIEYSGI